MGTRAAMARVVTVVAAAVAVGAAAVGVVSATGPAGQSSGTASATVASSVSSEPPGHPATPWAERWAQAWRSSDPTDLAALFTEDAVYTDHAAGKVSRGRQGVAAWEAGTHQLIADVDIELQDAFRSGDRVLVEGIYQGRIRGAPHAFAVPMVTVLHLRGEQIAADSDYYDVAELLRQSGLPPTWTPPAGTTPAATS